MPTPSGLPVVLTADALLMADYPSLLDGMIASSQTTATPEWLTRGLLAPSQPIHGLRARVAPLGLRRLESALRGDGFRADDVAIVAPHRLPDAIGPSTRLVAVSSGDPLGRGMNSNVMEALAGGKSRPAVACRRLLSWLRRRREQGMGFRVLLGGPGAWQLAQDRTARAGLGVDHVVTGAAEGGAPGLFRRLLRGERLPETITLHPAAPDDVPPLLGASSMGIVEISRGCGRGCRFCVLRSEPMRFLPAPTIVHDARINVRRRGPTIVAGSEDFLRYGAEPDEWARPDRLIALLRELRRVPGLGVIRVDHANVASVDACSDAELGTILSLLTGGASPRTLWVNLGVETVNGRLLADMGAAGKIRPHAPEKWEGLCRAQVLRLERAGFLPMVSLMVGLPKETPEDLRRTLDWVRSFRGTRAVFFPLFYAPLDPGEPGLTLAGCSPWHWRLIRECYAHNFRWMPRLAWDTQTDSGVPLWRRLATQCLGLGQTWLWRALFAARAWGGGP